MFDWFWEFLYALSKSIFRLIDAIVLGSRKLCGIDDITIKGEPTDFLSYLLNSQDVKSAFWTCCIIALTVLTVFTAIAIIRTTMKEKSEGTPVSIAMKGLKALLLFICVPAIMSFSVWFLDEVMLAVYKATGGTGSSTVGSFLFVVCCPDSLDADLANQFIAGDLNYFDTDAVWMALGDLSKFDFLLSWLAGVAVLFNITSMVLMFVDRAISIVLLFIAAPFSISTSVLDDGQRAKLWRDQVLIKFITGYGSIIALNIYLIVINLVMKGDMVFFGASDDLILSSSFMNNIMKVAVVLGGAFSLSKIMAVVGNLVAAGAGSNELRDSVAAGAAMGGFMKGAAGIAGGILKSPRAIYNFGHDAAKNGFGSTVADRLGFKTDAFTGGGGGGGGGKMGGKGGSGNGNNKTPDSGKSNKTDTVEKALNNSNNNQQEEKKDQKNNAGNMVLGALSQGKGLLGEGGGGGEEEKK